MDIDLVSVQDNALKLQIEVALNGRKLDRLEQRARMVLFEVNRRCSGPAAAGVH